MHLIFNDHTNTGETLKASFDLTLREYLRSITPEKGFGKSIKNLSKKLFIESVEALMPAHINGEQVAWALESLSSTPIIQLADGSSLLYDPETFLTNFLFQAACRERNIPFLFTQQCSRSKMMMGSNSTMGAGFVNLESDVYEVFDVKRARLAKASTSTLKGKVRFEFNPLGVNMPKYLVMPLPDILQELKGQSFQNAGEAILNGNQHIWSTFKLKSKKRLIQFDERLSAEVIRRHVNHPESPIHRILFDPNVRKSFLENQRDVIGSEDNLILKDTTHFFYYVDGEAIRPAKIQEAKREPVLVDAENGKHIAIDFTPEAIREALSDGRLFPDLIISYIGLSLLPGTLAFGGASQHEYLPEIMKILVRTNAEIQFLDNTIPAIDNNEQYAGSRMITGLVEMDQRLKRIIGHINRSTNLNALGEEILDKPLSETVGQMEYFDYFNIFLPKKQSKPELKG